MTNHRRVVSLSPFLMALLPRRVKLHPSASPLWLLLMALSMGSLCLGGYGYSPHPLAPTCFVAPRLALATVGYGRNSSARGC